MTVNICNAILWHPISFLRKNAQLVGATLKFLLNEMWKVLIWKQTVNKWNNYQNMNINNPTKNQILKKEQRLVQRRNCENEHRNRSINGLKACSPMWSYVQSEVWKSSRAIKRLNELTWWNPVKWKQKMLAKWWNTNHI